MTKHSSGRVVAVVVAASVLLCLQFLLHQQEEGRQNECVEESDEMSQLLSKERRLCKASRRFPQPQGYTGVSDAHLL